MPESLVRLLHARLIGFLREPEAVFWTFGFPVLIAIALGVAFRNKPAERFHVAVEERSGAAQIDHALAADAGVATVILPAERARQALRTGRVSLVVVPDGTRVTLRYDPTRLEGRAARLAVERALDRAGEMPHAYAMDEATVTEPGSRYIDFLVPGLIGMNVMSASMWGIGWSIVDARSRKLLKRYAATPMPRSHYLLSFILAHMVLVSASFALMVGFARLAFDVRVFGSYPALWAVVLFGAASFAGVAVLCAARTDNSETLSGLMNAVMLPMFVASGVFFSSEQFPAVVQPLIHALPLTALNDAMRAVMNDGASLTAIWKQAAVLCGWGAAGFALALRAFRWT
jgi:ABC-2 type transport system permease protein